METSRGVIAVESLVADRVFPRGDEDPGDPGGTLLRMVVATVDLADLIRARCAFLCTSASQSRSTLLGCCLVSALMVLYMFPPLDRALSFVVVQPHLPRREKGFASRSRADRCVATAVFQNDRKFGKKAIACHNKKNDRKNDETNGQEKRKLPGPPRILPA